jgi:hypothetical protein
MEANIRALGRVPRQRTTLYEAAPAERYLASFAPRQAPPERYVAVGRRAQL